MKYLKRGVVNVLHYLGLILLGVILLYVSALVIGTVWTVGEKPPLQDGEVNLFIKTNGLHTYWCLPVNNTEKDWRKVFPANVAKRHENSTYIGIGWGDEAFYQASKHGVSLSTTLRALFYPTSSLMHVQFYRHPPRENDRTIAISVREEEYRKLVKYILRDIVWLGNAKQARVLDRGYGKNDYFIDSKSCYHLLHTCNNWTNGGLKVMGIRTGRWTPLSSSIWYRLQ